MGKLRFVVWLMATGASAWWLATGVTWPATPEAQAMAIVRLVAAVLAAYLFVVTVLAIRLPRLAPRFVRTIVAGAVGSALLVAPMTAASAAPPDSTTTEAPVLRRISEEPPPPPAFSAPPARAGGVQPAENAEVVLEPGDHLWKVAEEELGRRLGRVPADGEVVPYWHELLRLNDGRLRSGNPSHVFPGEAVRLPS